MFARRAALGLRHVACALRRVNLFAFIIFAASTELSAQNADPSISAFDWTTTLLLALLILSVAASAFGWVKINSQFSQSNKLIAELEGKLDDAEALSSAEPHLLVVWQGQYDSPAQISNGLKDVPGVPAEAAEQYQFDNWLETGSAQRLHKNIASLREQGLEFNIILHSKLDALIEAAGRASGRRATLSLRHLTGERFEFSQASEESAALKNKLDKLSNVMDGLPIPMWFKDNKGRLTWINKAYLKAIESDDAALTITRQIELISPNDDANRKNKNKDEDDASNIVHTVMAGERRALTIATLELEDGVASLALDITELENTRKDLDQHITAHTRTLDQITAAIAIFGSDQRLRFFNEAYVELWHLDETFLKDHPSDSEILDALRETRSLPEQADYRRWKAKRLEIYTKTEPQEDWWHLPDGQTIRVVAEQHPFGGITYIYENVTEKLSLESRYNDLINVQRETLDNLHEGIALFGSDGRLKLYNPAYESIWKLHTHPLDDEPHIDDIIKWCSDQLPDDEVWVDLKHAVTQLPGEVREISGRMNRPDEKIIDFASVPLPDGAILLTYVDVSAAANVERALRERTDALETADRLKTEFISHISRELRTPLTNIIGFSDALAMGIAGNLNDKQGEYIGHILNSSDILLAFIDDILDLATIDAGVMELDLSEIKIAELIKVTAGLVQDKITEKNLSLKAEIASNADHFIADERRIKQILYNLLLNAIGFSQPGGKIFLKCYLEQKNICFKISDEGPGIELEQQSAVFERFESNPAGSSHRGAGLGLTIVKSFVELHGGSISLQSKPGEGTIITCAFPKQIKPNDTQIPHQELKSA